MSQELERLKNLLVKKILQKRTSSRLPFVSELWDKLLNIILDVYSRAKGGGK